MTENQKIRRLRALSRKIARSTGRKKKAAELDYDRTVKALARLVWVSSPPLVSSDPFSMLNPGPSVTVQGTFKRPR